MDNALYKAFTGNHSDLDAYLENATTIQLMADFRDMLRQLPGTADQDLKDFTMAAMQGLCAMNTKSEEVFASEDEAWAFLAKTAVKVAKATLSELQKQQS